MEEVFCVLGDCYKEECHHCFPVINCSFGHSWCKKYGCVEEINIKKKVLVTGCAGFIGFHTTKYLLENGYHIQVGIKESPVILKVRIPDPVLVL